MQISREPVRHMRVKTIRRRAFITVLGGMAVWPLAGSAQQPARVRRVGALMPFAENDSVTRAFVTAFVEKLGHFGWVEGRNIRIDYRFAAGDAALFKTYAAELVSLSPDAILASTPPSVFALQQQTRTIPIVFVLMLDPVGFGFVQSFARPGGNITGFSQEPELMGKWVQLLKEIAPGVTRVAVVFNPETTTNPLFNRAIEAAVPFFGITASLAPVRDDGDIEETIGAQARGPGGAVIALPDPFNLTHRDVIAAAATRHRLPLIGPPPLIEAGGLLSYFFDPVDLYAQAASYIDRILKGAKPADLPVQQPVKFSLIINLKTANALGLTVPQSLLQRADEVIE